MKNVILMAVVLLGTACVKIKGDMSVKEHLVYRVNGNAKILLAGEYEAKATLKGKRTLKLRVKNAFEKKTLKLRLPEGMTLPTANGTFSVSENELNQPFSAEGSLSTTRNVGELVDTTEPCWVYDNYYCDYDYEHRIPMGSCGSRRYPGTRDVTYRMVTTKQTLSLELVQDGASKATFTGTETDEQKVYETTGFCRY